MDKEMNRLIKFFTGNEGLHYVPSSSRVLHLVGSLIWYLVSGDRVI